MIFEFLAFFILLFLIISFVYQYMYDIFIWVLIACIIFYITYVTIKIISYYNQKRSPVQETAKQFFEPVKQTKFTSEVQIDNDIITLRDYIKKNLGEGFKINIIKAALLKQGWPESKVNQAIIEASK